MTTPGKTRVAIVFGGRSPEHGISCVSAGSVLGALDPDEFEVVPVGITRAGQWVLTSGDPAQLAINARRLPEITAEAGADIVLRADPTGNGLMVLDPTEGPRALADVDVVFPVLHGAYGEDGTIQGMLEMAGIPYVGANVFASAAAMDKEFTKKLCAAEGIPVGPYAVLRNGMTLERGGQGAARPAGLRQAVPGRLVVRHHQGHRLGRPGRRGRRRPADRPEGAGRGRDRRPRDRVRRAGGRGRRRARGVRAGRGAGRRRPRLLRLRGEVPRRLPASTTSRPACRTR